MLNTFHHRSGEKYVLHKNVMVNPNHKKRLDAMEVVTKPKNCFL